LGPDSRSPDGVRIEHIRIDNVSNVTGASEIYFGNLQNNTAVQASQQALS